MNNEYTAQAPRDMPNPMAKKSDIIANMSFAYSFQPDIDFGIPLDSILRF